MDDYYKTLQVDPSADPEVIQAAYRRLADKHHPDHNPGAGSLERMKQLNVARDILLDPVQRARYDEERRRMATTQAGQGASQPNDTGQGGRGGPASGPTSRPRRNRAAGGPRKLGTL